MNTISDLASAIIAGSAVSGLGLFFAVQYFSGMKNDIKDIKAMIEKLPCEKHGEDISFIRGKINGN